MIYVGDLSGDVLTTGEIWGTGVPDLATAALVLLGTDRRADATEVRDDDARGWWGDDFGGRYGSRLWLLHSLPATADSARLAEIYVAEALAPLITAGLATAVKPSAVFTSTGGLAVSVTIQLPSGAEVELWQ